MTRGNQRDLARAKNMKKQAGQKAGNALSGSELAKSKEDSRKIMLEKQAKADAKKKEAEAAAVQAKMESKKK